MTQIKIARVTNPEDAGRIARVHHMSRQKAYAGIMPAPFLNKKSFSDRERQWFENVEKSAKGDGMVWLAQCGGFDAGVASAGAAHDADLDSKTVGELYMIYVLPDYWKQGVGKSLFDQAVDELKKQNFKQMVVWVYEPHEMARKFYEKQGMKLTDKKKPLDGLDSVSVVRYSMPIK